MATKVFSPTNIALAKYWGKRNTELNLPSNSSVSVTLDGLGSTTKVLIDSKLKNDVFILNKKLIESEEELKKIKKILNIFRKLLNKEIYFYIESENNFPTASGLASSASGISALVSACNIETGLNLSNEKLMEISRLGSGSSCRSFFGGFVFWDKGVQIDGSDSIAYQIAPHTHWQDLKIIVLVFNTEKKKLSSTKAMLLSQETSPFFNLWPQYAENSAHEIKKYILEKNFLMLASEAQNNCIRMHSTIMSSNPSIFYWNENTFKTILFIEKLRTENRLNVFFTIDAGANVVLFYLKEDEEKLKNELSKTNFLNAKDIINTKVGEGLKILS
jgi:diphosphomevalonate decarboxylase